MALASSELLLSFRALVRSRRPRLARAVLRTCPRCYVRPYSDHNGAAQQDGLEQGLGQEQEQRPVPLVEQSASAADGESKDTGESAPNFMDLMEKEEENRLIPPDLNALDELGPSRSKFPRNKSGHTTSRDENREQTDLWRKTLHKVNHSFTLKQLAQMCADAKVPRDLYRRYSKKRNRAITKDLHARVLLTHRFQMQDPSLREAEERREMGAQAKVVQWPISQIALLLVALQGQKDIQMLMQTHRVTMRPVSKDGEEAGGISLAMRGSKEGIEAVQAWLQTFCDSIRSTTLPLSFFSLSQAPPALPSHHHLRHISRSSQSIVSLQDEEGNIAIHSTDDSSLATAKSLLFQLQHNALHFPRRRLFSYASPAIPAEPVTTVPTFALVPHVGSSPLPWLFDPGPSASLFRLTRQDNTEASVNPFASDMQQSSDRPLLRSVDTTDTYSIPAPADLGSDVLEELQAGLSQPRSSSLSYTAEFGHLLYDNHNQASSSRILSLINPPIPGSWPLEHALLWIRQEDGSTSRENGKSPRLPAFFPSLPPVAVHLDAGSATASPGSLSSQGTIQSGMQLLGGPFRDFGLFVKSRDNDLNEFVDLNPVDFAEMISITYGSDGPDLVVELKRVVEEVESEEGEGERKARWTFHRAQWLHRSLGDILVPEASVDVRLGAQHCEAVEEANLRECEELLEYLDQQTSVETSSLTSSVEEEKEVRPPSTVVVQGKTTQLVSARRASRWSWDLVRRPDSPFVGKLVLERAAMGREAEAVSSLKIALQREERVGQEGGEQGKEGETAPQWEHLRPYVDSFLSTPYRSLRSR